MDQKMEAMIEAGMKMVVIYDFGKAADGMFPMIVKLVTPDGEMSDGGTVWMPLEAINRIGLMANDDEACEYLCLDQSIYINPEEE